MVLEWLRPTTINSVVHRVQSGMSDFALFGVDADEKLSVVEEGRGAWGSIVATLPGDRCLLGLIRFVVPDHRVGLVFLLWAPDGSTVRERMIICSSQEAFLKQLMGDASDTVIRIQGMDKDDLTLEEATNTVTQKMDILNDPNFSLYAQH
eukprot:TRINITY_DN6055_c0_g1_i3.p2 TRINITY_DN6055_c0_g1~~TRINITY_DN6055_c0_g1_i3.p2  ORF type:complete len:150 (-),score=42.67 TRINITY_DN6055_c0_g1_i3:77-526(-)